MESTRETEESWKRLLQAARRLQSLVPGTVLVGGTAAALHASHRISLDDDHVLEDLSERFEEVLEGLEATAGWRTERIKRPVLILGDLDGCLSGLRQLRRSAPLEVETIQGLRVPTLPEMTRIKAWLLLNRDAVRDYLDTVVLLECVGETRLREVFRPFDAMYVRGPQAGSPLVELIDRLGLARPGDLAAIELESYKGVVAPWNDWSHVAERGRSWAARLSALAMEP
jgi:hypothetical protein